MAFAIEACRRAEIEEAALDFWFGRKPKDARRARLHGWRLWYTYCVENDISVDDMISVKNPAIMVGTFCIALDMVGVKDYCIGEARLAVVDLFEFLQPLMYSSLLHSGFVKSIMTSISTKIKRAPKYLDMWPLGKLLRYIQSGPAAEDLCWSDLMPRAAAVFVIFIPCRPIVMIRMDGTKESWRAERKALVVGTREKTDKGRGYTELVLRALPQKNLCPLSLYCLLKSRAAQLGARGALFCSADGKSYLTSAPLSRLLKNLLKLAGIDPQYPAYSIRHALITALIDGDLKEHEVNAYTGHSNNAHTAFTSYFHLNTKWIGRALACEQPSERARREALPFISKDNEVFQREEMSEYGEEDPAPLSG
jgi:hypothetical protein